MGKVKLQFESEDERRRIGSKIRRNELIRVSFEDRTEIAIEFITAPRLEIDGATLKCSPFLHIYFISLNTLIYMSFILIKI